MADHRARRTGGGPRFRPLDRVGSIRTKVAIVVVVAVGVSTVVTAVGLATGVNTMLLPPAAMAIALGFGRLLAAGMTGPLRDLEEAATAMAAGDLSRRVPVTSEDEVGRLARAFNAMAAQVEEVDALRRDLVADVSHELRTPLAALQAHLENIVDGVEPADPAVLASLVAQTDRLGRLVRQLLDLSRLQAGAVPLVRSMVEVEELFAAVIAEAQLAHPAVRVDSAVEPPGLAVAADAVQLHQVLANLIDNAARHGGGAGPVELRAATGTDGVVLEVADAGPGIPPAELGQVFERFHRADGAPASGLGGTGLGLAIARGIVELHGGRIRAEARTPTGCRMVVELPA